MGGRCSQNMLQRLRCRKNRRTGRYEPPSEPTIRRLLRAVEAEAVDRVLSSWLASLVASDAVALDGKTLRGARRDDASQVQLLSAFPHQQGITLAQRTVPRDGNEIPVARALLEPPEVAGKVITADAPHTQTELARFIVERKKADYCFPVKDNQPTLKEDIAGLRLEEAFPPSA